MNDYETMTWMTSKQVMCTIKVVTDKCAKAHSHLTHPEFQPKYDIPAGQATVTDVLGCSCKYFMHFLK